MALTTNMYSNNTLTITIWHPEASGSLLRFHLYSIKVASPDLNYCPDLW